MEHREMNFDEDEDRTEWDRAWRERPLRQLVNPAQIDVVHTPDPTWGKSCELKSRLTHYSSLIEAGAILRFAQCAEVSPLPISESLRRFIRISRAAFLTAYPAGFTKLV